MKTTFKISASLFTILLGNWALSQQSFEVSSTATAVTCYGDQNGSIELYMMGGVPPYQFQWSNGATSQNLYNLEPNTYTVIITDSQGTAVFEEVDVTGPTQPITITGSVSHVTTFNGNNGSINVNVTGGNPAKFNDQQYDYSWSNGATVEDLTSLTTGFYTLTVTDLYGCTDSKLFHVIQPSSKGIANTTSTKAVIEDVDPNSNLFPSEILNGIISVKVINARTGEESIIEVDNGNFDIKQLERGDYILQYTDDNSITISNRLSII